ncbi:four-carbon acid sugar kinase family protein [Cupriavidus sp. RAF12]|uniref:four-carbon acid sugar kinase family protein n=1 Tax=Cupriavidus sp. RAF12 TaxID=3233050 RepID=UPI003F929F9E
MSWLIIADDLSGAADCAIGFAAHGARTVVTLEATASADIADADVVAADVDSRRMTPQDAAARNLDAWHRSHGAGRRLYKKIDSTLRGNWAAETGALQPLAGLAIVAPAFPATGRTTRNGCMLINGQPLEGSDIWQLEGLTGRADMVALLAAQGLRAALVPLDTVRAGASAVQAMLTTFAGQGVQAVVCDADVEQDLMTLAEASTRIEAPAFWVGSGGLARALSALSTIGAVAPAAGDKAAEALHHDGPVLTLVGSLSGVSGRQAACLCEQGRIASLVVPPQALRDGPGHAGWDVAQQSVAECLLAGRDLLVSIGRDDAFDPAEGPRLSAALAQLVLPYFDRVGGLIATGGETARAMLAAAGITALTLRREIEPGVPLSITRDTPTRRVATKAGAFGTDAALWLAWQAMRQD